MSAPTFNKFKSTTIYGNFNNVDFTDSSGGVITPATAYFQSDVTSSGIIYGKKLFYDNVDISSTFVSNLTLSSTLSNYALSSALTPYALSSSLSNYALSSTLSNYALSSALSNYALSSTLSNYALSSALTPYALSSSLNNYALLSGATFTGALNATTQATSNNSTLVATTAFVKAQNYLTSNPDLSPYALLSGATFTGALNATTQALSNNSTLVATTAYVKGLNYITSSALSPYALSSTLSNYALSSTLNNYALSTTLINYALSSTLNNYALLSGATFTGTVNCNNVLNITQPSSTTSPILQYVNDIGQARALIYPSAIANVLRFSILSTVGMIGYEWENRGNILMTLDLSGNLTIAGNLTSNNTSSIPLYSTITVPTTNTHDNFQGNYYTTYSVRPTNSVNTLNGVSTVNVGIPFIGGNTQFPNFNPITITSVYFALGTLANPDTPQNSVYCVISSSYGATPTNTTNFFNINMYNVNGSRIRGYGTLLKSFSTNSYSIIFVATDGVGFALNTTYYYDPFQFTYI